MSKALSLIARGAGFYFAGFAVSKVLAYLYRALLARGLGPDAFGIFSIGVSVIGILAVFAALGLYQGIMHFASVYGSTRKEARARGTILFSFKAQVVASLAFAAGLFLSADYIAVSFFHEEELATVLRILSLSLPFAVITSGLMVVVLVFKKIEYKIYVRNIAENLAKLFLTGLFLFLGFHLLGATIALALSSVAAFLISIYLVQKKVFPLFARNLKAKSNARELFSYSWPLLAVGFFDVIMMSIDTIMLGHLSRAYNVGIYNVAQPTANLMLVASFAFGSLFLPIITGFYAQRKLHEMKRLFKTVTKWIFAVTFPSVLFLCLFAGEILAAMFGDVYAQGAGALIVLAFGVFLASFIGPVEDVLESIGRTKWIFLNTVVGGVINVFLNLWLIPLFEARGVAIVGAALATTASFILWKLLSFAEVFFFTRMHPYSKAYLAPTLASCVAIALFWLVKALGPDIGGLAFPLDFLLLAFFGCVFLALYAVLFVVFRGLQPEDLIVLRAIESKTGIRVRVVRNIVKRFI